MAKQPFITRLNWRLILLHFVACWCFAWAFHLLSCLHDLDMVRAIMGFTYDKKPFAKEFGGRRIYIFDTWLALSTMLGILVAFALSMVISFLKKWFWLNGFISFLLVTLLFVFKITGWNWLKQVFLKPGDIFRHPSAGYFITNGGVLLLLGLLCLFLPAAIRFIDAGQKTSISAEPESLNPGSSVQA